MPPWPRALPVRGINWEKPSPALSLCIIDEPLRAAMTYGLSCLAFPLDFSLGLVGSMAGYGRMEERCLFRDGMPRNSRVSHLQGLGQVWGQGQGWLPNETPVPKVPGRAVLPHSGGICIPQRIFLIRDLTTVLVPAPTHPCASKLCPSPVTALWGHRGGTSTELRRGQEPHPQPQCGAEPGGEAGAAPAPGICFPLEAGAEGVEKFGVGLGSS